MSAPERPSESGGGGVPQIVLNVPPEVLRLLTGILSSLQRLEGEVRDCRLRLGYPAVAAPRAAASPAHIVEVAPASRPPRAIHTPAGTRAASRMRRLRTTMNLSPEELGPRLGISGSMVRVIENAASGITYRVDQAMQPLEASNGGQP